MGLEWEELKLPALGRPAFLGQLYDASSEHLLNVQLFTAEMVKKTQTIPNAFTSIKYKDVNTITDRARAMDISAELSVGILSGLIELKGSGQYLDSNKSNVSSHEVSMVCTVRKDLERLDLGNDTFISKSSFNRAVRRGASHVVTGIVYGGTLVTSVTEKASTAESKSMVHGRFSASIMKKIGNLFSAEGKTAVDMDETSKEVFESHDFDFYGDYASPEQANPTTIGDLFELAKKWPKLVGKGVPCELIATPLADLVDESIETKVLHELESDELAALLTVYDQVYHLAGRRARLQTVLEIGLGQYCPTFLSECRERKSNADGILGRSRKALSKYLVAYRDGGVEKAGGVEQFLEEVKKGYNDSLKGCEKDESMLELLQDIRSLAVGCGVPLATLSELRGLMIRTAHGMLGVVLIPTSPNIDSAINMYNVLVANIRRWRADEDTKDLGPDRKPKQTVFVTYYCDGLLTRELLKLDGKKAVLTKALTGLNQSRDARFVHYGTLPSGLVQKQFDWSLLNDEGWGFLPNKRESWYYVGQMHNGKRHGRGTVTYADGSTYSGDWWQDTRHGQGVLVEKNKHTVGVFIENQYRSDGVIVDLTKIACHAPVAAYKIPLRKRDATTSHVLRIATMLGWTDAEEYKLVINCANPEGDSLELIVVGRLLKQGQDDLYNASWPLDKEVDIKVQKCC
ncbi:neoverrucotoxin subunit alpha-like [Moniliophthora roreri]|uniref:SNTX MACPF/CDC-like domain-containing protein n=1 Tax=Moniliophthora roreri TaxID=221103 RepID=A0A0W0FTT1_MONRR|nr:neoverrucotoxin subunit alpha-like [Moniliophthora roreri]